MVYKFDEKDVLRLKGCQFWNIPYEDLETQVKLVWERTQDVIRNGLQITVKMETEEITFQKLRKIQSVM